jgi:uncharacterized protein YbaP (TraB family)
MRRRLSAWLAGALAFALSLGGAGPAAAKPPIWTVHSKQATLVLFGSIHLLPAGLDWRPPALDEALAGATEIWFELPIDARTDNEAANAAQKRGALGGDKRLTALLTADQTDRLLKAANELHCEPGALDRMQPWMAELTLSVAEDAQGGGTAFNGVEEQVQAIAPLVTPRRAFETASQQIDFLAGASQKDQIASLDWTLREIGGDPASYQRVVDEWMAADLDGIERDAVAPLRSISPGLYERLIGQRNRKWAKALAARLKKPGQIVVVVGVGHMIGPEGLPALLRAQGLTVDGP